MAKSIRRVAKGISIIGGDELAKKLLSLTPKMQDKTSRILFNGGRLIVEEAKSSMSLSPATGKTYGDHVASSPGNPPRVDTEDLINTVKSKPEQFSKEDPEYRIGVFKESGQAEKAIWLEFGTKKMEARPFMRPAYLKKRKQILSNIRRALIRELKNL